MKLTLKTRSGDVIHVDADASWIVWDVKVKQKIVTCHMWM